MVPIDHAAVGTKLEVFLPTGVEPEPAEVHPVPFYDPKKEIAKGKSATG